jgi:hypothetical protein
VSDEPLPPTSTPDPNWPRDALTAAMHEVGDYLALVWQTVAHPRRFYIEWSAGQRRALNPLAAMLNAVAVLGVWQIILRHALDMPPKDNAWWLELAQPILAAARACVFGLVCHFGVWIFGARRPLRTTLGAVLYCSGGAITFLELVLLPIFVYAEPLLLLPKHELGVRMIVVMASGMVYSVAMLALLSVAIASAQGRKGWRIVVPVLVACIATISALSWTRRHHAGWMQFLG